MSIIFVSGDKLRYESPCVKAKLSIELEGVLLEGSSIDGEGGGGTIGGQGTDEYDADDDDFNHDWETEP